MYIPVNGMTRLLVAGDSVWIGASSSVTAARTNGGKTSCSSSTRNYRSSRRLAGTSKRFTTSNRFSKKLAEIKSD